MNHLVWSCDPRTGETIKKLASGTLPIDVKVIQGNPAEQIVGKAPAIIVLDLEMPQVDGMAFIQSVLKKSASIPIITVTTSDQHGIDSIKSGACDYLLKPINATSLQHAMNLTLAKAEVPLVSHSQGSFVARLAIKTLALRNDAGQLDADSIATALNITLKDVAKAIDVKYSTLHKTPAAKSAQGQLQVIADCIELLNGVFHEDRKSVLSWLNSHNDRFTERTPLETILKGEAFAVRTILHNTIEGIPD